MKHKKGRIVWLDLVRCIAILCVVMCHAVEGQAYVFSAEFMQSMSVPSRLFAFAMLALGRLGVPLFLLASGYLLLDKEYSDRKCIKFWKDKCGGIFIASAFWGVMYLLFTAAVSDRELVFMDFIYEIFWLKPSCMNHMWYVPMIFGLYLLLPVFANAIHTVRLQTLLLPYLVIVLSTFGADTMYIVCRIFGLDTGSSLMDTGFSGGMFGAYLVAGYALKKKVLKGIPSILLGFIDGVGLLLLVVLQFFCSRAGVATNVYYNNILLLICGCITFELISRMKKVPVPAMVSAVSKYSFAIYLVHNIINHFMQTGTEWISFRPLRVMIIWGVTMVLSFIASYLINKIPVIGKRILYMR